MLVARFAADRGVLPGQERAQVAGMVCGPMSRADGGTTTRSGGLELPRAGIASWGVAGSLSGDRRPKADEIEDTFYAWLDAGEDKTASAFRRRSLDSNQGAHASGAAEGNAMDVED